MILIMIFKKNYLISVLSVCEELKSVSVFVFFGTCSKFLQGLFPSNQLFIHYDVNIYGTVPCIESCLNIFEPLF